MHFLDSFYDVFLSFIHLLEKAVAERLSEAVSEAVSAALAQQAAYIKELEAKLAMQTT